MRHQLVVFAGRRADQGGRMVSLPAAYVLSAAGHRERTPKNYSPSTLSPGGRVHGDRQQLPPTAHPTDVSNTLAARFEVSTCASFNLHGLAFGK